MEKKEAMKVMLNKAWEQVENKEELLETIAKKEPSFNEEQKLAFAKLFAYTQLNKKEDVYDEHDKYNNKSLDLHLKNPKTKVTYEKHKMGEGRGDWHSVEIKHGDKTVHGFGAPKMTSAIARAKEHAKMNKSEELEKAAIWERKQHRDDKAIDSEQKGVHRPAVPTKSGEVFSAKKKGSGFSHTGLEVRKNPSFKNKDAIKDTHKQIISEQKKMPKPNLPKSELNKAGGVHSEVTGLKGQSVQGMKVRDANKFKAKGDKQEHRNLLDSAKRMHQYNLEDAKKMPKPNLPKSELNKAKVEEMKLDLKKPMKKEERNLKESGINLANASSPKGGKSVAGTYIRNKDNVKAKQVQSNTLNALKQFPKPNLPKSEMAKEEKGVHQPVFGKYPTGKKGGKKTTLEGLSEAGAQLNVYNANKAANWVNKEKSKEAHKKILSEQKKMPKPNLPKSEMAKEEKGVHQPVLGKMKTMFGRVNTKMPAKSKKTLEGMSEAGYKARLGSKYNTIGPRTSFNQGESDEARQSRKDNYKKQANESSKKEHKKTLSEAKEIKPNLPKSENMMKGKSTISKPSEPAPNYDAKTWDKPKKSLQDHIKEQKPSYDSKHPKIDIYHKGNYSHSTNWHPTVKSALEHHLKENPSHDPKDVKASISKK